MLLLLKLQPSLSRSIIHTKFKRKLYFSRKIYSDLRRFSLKSGFVVYLLKI